MASQNRFENGLSRREFIQLSGTASLAVLAFPSCASNGQNRDLQEGARFQNQTLPVLHQCDVLVVGGSFSGVSTALEFAGNGKKVVLVEKRIYLGREITSTCRPWIDLEKGTGALDLPEILQSCIEADIDQPFADSALLRFDHVKLTLENALLENQVYIVYASNPVQLIKDGDLIRGLVIGNKSGRQAILAKMVVDCTETASVTRLSQCGFLKPIREFFTFVRTLEFTQIEPLKNYFLDMPASLRIKDNRVSFKPGYLGKNHYYVECAMEFTNPLFDPESTVLREMEAWERSIGVAKYLYEEVPEFKDAFLTSSSYQLHGLYTGQMEPISSDKVTDLCGSRITAGTMELEISSFATGFRNLWCVNEAARLESGQTKYLMTPQGAYIIGTSVARWLDHTWDGLAASGFLCPAVSPSSADRTTLEPGVRESYSPQRGKVYERIQVANEFIPMLAEVDVLVAGGGTSGATATYVAAEKGIKVMVVDLNPGFGGTGTLGGVMDYWGHGKYKGFVANHVKNVEDIHEFIPNHISRYHEYWAEHSFITWNIQAKMYMWLREIRRSGAQVMWNSIVIGSIVEGRDVKGVIVATPQGVFSIKSKVVIDATGDGDVAGFAGAPFVLGSSRDHVPLWYALCRSIHPGITQTTFQSTVDVTNISDYTRSVHVGMRTGEKPHDHTPYLAPRESRHILGEVVVTLTDHLKFRQWEDVINIHFSNCDMKGYHASDWLRIGLIPPNLNIEIPYRSIIPREIENIIVVGKAFSNNHGSIATVRMQPDLENLGGIAALAAAMSLDDGVSPRNLKVKSLQERLVELQLLPAGVLEREIKTIEYSEEELEHWIDQFQPSNPLHKYSDMDMTEIWEDRIPFVEVASSPPEIALPVLERKLREASGERALHIALAIAILGSEEAAPIICREIESQLSEGILPLLKAEIKHYSGDAAPPGQAAMPQCANLIYALGMTRSELNLTIWNKVAALFQPDDPDDFYSKDKALFYYVDAVCYGAELKGDPGAIPALRKMHENQFIKRQSLKQGIEEEFILERRALMELILGRAMARCGSPDGIEILIDYLDDMRAILAEFAHTTLSRISGHDFGKNQEAWTKWLTNESSKLKPAPLLERIDG